MNRSKHVCIIEFDRILCIQGDARPKYLNSNYLGLVITQEKN
jgi:hypothetical protein